MKLPTPYPSFDVYPASYPFNLDHIYPNVQSSGTFPLTFTARGSSLSRTHYPHLEIYPSVYYPGNLDNIYPHLSARFASNLPTCETSRRISTGLPTAYPNIHVYTPVYPYSLQGIYPPILATTAGNTAVSDGFLSLHSSQYPFFDIYPVTRLSHKEESNMREASVVSKICISLDKYYPHICLYPPTYPNNLKQIYPNVTTPRIESEGSLGSSTYPILIIYPAVYPHNLLLIYPPRSLECAPSSHASQSTPYVSSVRRVQRSSKSSVTIVPPLPTDVQSLRSTSPLPDPPVPSQQDASNVTVSLSAVYPNIRPYPAVYPFFDLYPEHQHMKALTGSRRSYLALSLTPFLYPIIEVYPAVYPHLTPYPPVCSIRALPGLLVYDLKPRSHRPKYTHADLHRQVLSEVKPLSVGTSDTSETGSASPPTPPKTLPRPRSGTVSTRSSLPPAPGGEPSSTVSNRASMLPRHVPTIPAFSQSSADGAKPRVVGLPSHPAMMKRQSSRPTFTTLPTVQEPDISVGASDNRQIERKLEVSERISSLRPPQVSASTIQRSSSLTQPRRSVLPGAQTTLSRSDTIPTRTKRHTSVFDRVKAFDAIDECEDY